MSPHIRRSVLKMYGQDSEGVSICPGEADCEKWASAAPSPNKERNVCQPCSMFPTKTESGKRHLKTLLELADTGMYLRRRRNSGYPAKLHELTPLEFDALLMTDAEVEHEEIKIRSGVKQALIAGFGLKVE